MHVGASYWLHEISISKTIDHHFWHGLMVGLVIWGHSNIKQFENFLNATPHLMFGRNDNIVLNNTLRPHNFEIYLF
jgi:hypothetical protein